METIVGNVFFFEKELGLNCKWMLYFSSNLNFLVLVLLIAFNNSNSNNTRIKQKAIFADTPWTPHITSIQAISIQFSSVKFS